MPCKAIELPLHHAAYMAKKQEKWHIINMKIYLIFSLLILLISCSSKMDIGSYKMEEVEIEFPTYDKKKLKAFLSLPISQYNAPAVLLLKGSGKNPRKREKADDPFKLLAHYLTTRGYAVLRFDKRGSGINRDAADFSLTSYEDNYQDALSALEFLKKQKNVESKQLFILGQSMGGRRATKLALTSKPKGLILVSTPTRDFLTFNNEQLETLYLSGLRWPRKKVMSVIRGNTLFYTRIKMGAFTCSQYPKRCTHKKGQTVIEGQPLTYWEEVIKDDQKERLQKLTTPTLILQGKSDWIVSKEDALMAKDILTHSGNNDVDVEILPEMDHFLFKIKNSNESLINFMQKSSGSSKVKPLPIHMESFDRIFQWLEKRKG